MDKHPITTNPSLSRVLMEAAIANKVILVSEAQPHVFESICPDGIRKWIIIANVIYTQNGEILDDKVQVGREAV